MKVIIPVLMVTFNNKKVVVDCLKMKLKMKGRFWYAKLMVILWLEMWLYCGRLS